MAIATVTGAPFSGKSEFARQEIAQRESAGELGLVLLGFSELFRALVPGGQSQFRDEAVGDTGAPRLAGHVFGVAAAAMADRELSGYVVTQSPRQALALADRFDGPLFEVVTSVGDTAIRVSEHMSRLAVDVARATAENSLAGCRRQAIAYFRERKALAGRAVEVKRKGRGFQKGAKVREFDRELWLKGLTPRGREAVAELVSLGNAEPSPSDVMSFLLKNPVEA